MMYHDREMGSDVGETGRYHAFPRTTWRTIINLKDNPDRRFREQMGRLISLYWKPVYSYLRFVKGGSEVEASDLTQEFFSKLLEKNFLKNVSPEKGLFRSFLKVSLGNFLVDHHKKESAQKRGGENKRILSDQIEPILADRESSMKPDDYFDRQWAESLIVRSAEVVKERLGKQGKENYVRVFDLYYQGASHAVSRSKYDLISRELGISKKNVDNYLVYIRKLLKRVIKEEINEYVLDEDDVETELNYIFEIVKKFGLSL